MQADVSCGFFGFPGTNIKVVDFASKFVYSSPESRAKKAVLIILFVEFLRS